ncbi:MAG TPA: tetratricopeptide repeat protein [Pyrinomonadaceae bacterium]|nr:tetratricopeptide repeat protein [Pyrinomonadaceae bacterium]
MSEETWNSAGRLEGVTKHEWGGYELKGVDGTWTLVEALWDRRTPRVPRLHAQPPGGSGRPDPPFILPQLDIATFTGRVEELARLESLLLPSEGAKMRSIVGVAGGPGLGKSALACHFASLHREDFSDGVLGLRVDGKNVDTIAREFARLCGEEIEPEDERQPATIMQEVFAHRRMLLIFDNAEDAAIQELRPGGQTCAVIITTRDRELPFLLDTSEEGRIDLSPLPLPDARLLLEQLIGEHRVGAEREAVEEIIKLIGSLPLALQIVGSALHLQQDRNIGDYATSLRTERERLERLKIRGAPNLDVLASFSLSLRLLSDEEIDFFACQSVCAQDGFSLQAATAAGACDEATAYERLNYLYRLSLLNRPRLGVGRFVFHTLIRLFAQDLAVEGSLLEAAAERHARYFIQLVKTSEPTDHRSRVLVAENSGDCILAAAWLHQRQVLDHEFVIGLERFLEHCSWQEATTLMTDFLTLAERQEDWTVVVRFRIKQARCSSFLGDWAQAEEMLVLAADTIGWVEDLESRQRLTARWFAALGGVRQRQRRFDEAADAFRRSVDIDEQRGELEGQAMMLGRLGGVLRRQGRLDDAVDAFQRSVFIQEQTGNLEGQAMELGRLGSVLQRQGHFDTAVGVLERSITILEQLGKRRSLATVLNSMGGALQRLGRLDEAVYVLQRSIAIFEQLGDQRNLAIALNSLGSALQRQGRFRSAAMEFRRSAEIEGQLENRRGQAMVLNSLGGSLQRQGQLDEAVDAFRRSVAISEQLDDERTLAMGLNSLGSALQRQGKLNEAMDALKRSYMISEQLGDQLNVAMILNSMGGVLRRQGRLDEAIDAFRRRIAISEHLGDERSLAMALNSLGSTLKRQGNLDEAMDVLKRSYAISEQLEDQLNLAIILNSIADVLRRLGKLDEAMDALKRSADIGETLGDELHLANILNNMGRVLQRQGKVNEAVNALKGSRKIFEQLGDQRNLAMVDARLKALSERLAGPVTQQHLVIKKGAIKRIIPHAQGYRYGFIVPDDAGGDIYFKESDVQPDDLPHITEGARVEFGVLGVPKGRQAKNVRII